MADHDTHDHTGVPGAGSPTEITDIPTAETDDTLVLAPDGAGGVEFRAEAGGSDPAGFTTIVTSADQDVTNNTNQDHTELQFATVAGKHYMTDLYLMVGGSDATGDFAFRYAVTAGTLSGRTGMILNDGTLAVATSSFAASAAATTGSITIGTPADVTFPTAVRLSFAFLASNTTTFKLQFGNAAASSGRISRVFKGSFLRYKQTD